MRPFPWKQDPADFLQRYSLVREHRELFDALTHACAVWSTALHSNAWASRELVELYAAFLQAHDDFPEADEFERRIAKVYAAFVAAAEAVEGALLDAEEIARRGGAE